MDLKSISQGLRKGLKVKPCGAVIVAAGTASRMGGIDKVMAPLEGEPMIVRTVRTFQNSDVISEIVIVTRPDLLETVAELCREMDKVRAVVTGGSSRQESVCNGLAALSPKMKLAAVQDGARPLISGELIDRVVRAAHTYGAAAPGIPVKDTVKIVTGGIVERTPDRNTLRAIQTPQVFDVDLLQGALEKAKVDGAEVTDDCSAVERLGMSVRIVDGEERNMKITTPLDLAVAKMLLEEQK
ncbi:MAG: 2-C-methyl-D-erythritol 4-phosphate cytidylyltransferase [Oscillospiraceae bacterium]|nr:2-C-methyl-D-erythritol 4-phosphate cytidylyltransferase [Oscillospiraceae bacterium]